MCKIVHDISVCQSISNKLMTSYLKKIVVETNSNNELDVANSNSSNNTVGGNAFLQWECMKIFLVLNRWYVFSEPFIF